MSDPIWFQAVEIARFQQGNAGNMIGHLGIEMTEVGPDWISGRMPVDHRTRQPMGLLHGGASVVLAETLGSVAANLVVDPAKFFCVGQEINANHLRGARGGFVHGIARPFHLGRTSQVWGIEIHGDNGEAVCVARITMAVVPRRETPTPT